MQLIRNFLENRGLANENDLSLSTGVPLNILVTFDNFLF